MANARDRLLGQTVEVEWIDSCGDSGWVGASEVGLYNVSSNRTAGYLVSRDGHQVKVAQSRCTTPGVKPWGSIISIPVVAVRRIKRLR